MRFVTSDGLSLDYQDEGEGPLPLLCLPGLTRNGADFDDLAAALGGRHRLIRLTLRGRGASDRDPEARNYNVVVEARDVVEFLDELGLGKIVIIGTSRGGLIAMMLGVTAKDRLAGVLLNDVGAELAEAGLDAIKAYVGVEPRARSFGEAAAALQARLGERFPGLSAARWEVLARRWFEAGDGRLRLNYDPRIRESLETKPGAPPLNLWPLFAALDGVPLALVRGAHSDLLTPETVARMRDRRPDMIVAEVPDRGHVPFLDEPEALAALQALLARIGAAS